MTRVIQLVTQMEAGGAQRVAIQLAEELKNKGHESEVWFLYIKRPVFNDLYYVRSLWQTEPKGTDYLWIVFRLVKNLLIAKPNVLITHTHYANILGQIIARILHIPNRIAVQHNAIHTYPSIAATFDKIIGTSGFYTKNVAVSNNVATDLKNLPRAYTRRLNVIPNGIADPIAANTKSFDWRSHLGIPNDSLVLLNIGRLAHQKNQAFLLQILSNTPNAHLIVAGEGELRQYLTEQALRLGVADRFHLCGELEHSAVFTLVRQCDIFLFPSLFEAMPLALLEAMRAGLPTIANTIPATEEFLGDAGRLLPLVVENWADAIGQLRYSQQERARLSTLATLRAKQYSLQRMGDAYNALL